MHHVALVVSLLSATCGSSSLAAIILMHNGMDNYFGVSLRLFANIMAWLACVGLLSFGNLKNNQKKGLIILFNVIGILTGAVGGLSVM